MISIPTWTEKETLEYLAKLAKRSTTAIDLGVYFGASSYAMLEANPNLHLWSVDKFAVFGSKEIAEMFLDPWIKSGNCEIIVGDSTTAANMLQHMRGKIDLAFVDNGHEEWQVERDIKDFLPLLSPNGVLCGHDFDIPHNDVARGVIKSGIDYFLPVPRLWQKR